MESSHNSQKAFEAGAELKSARKPNQTVCQKTVHTQSLLVYVRVTDCSQCDEKLLEGVAQRSSKVWVRL